ncbi:MAG: DMT family transporter [Neisseria sp.]|nr:DMT family transporter [Neisseria sp.]
MVWVAFTLLAASMQAWRNAAQKELSKTVPVLGVTLARFLYACPLAAAYLWLVNRYGNVAAAPDFSGAFFAFVAGAGLAQIAATALMVQLFRLKNYAIGAGLAKSEAVIAAVLGVCFFGTQIGWLGWLGVAVGAVAVFLLTGVENMRHLSWQTLLTGLGSGLCFALTSLWIREASLSLHTDYLLSAAWVLFGIITMQTVLLTVYLALCQRETLKKLWHKPKLAWATSVFSFLGSFGWFHAMSLQDVAFVKTVGQIEVLFMLLISHFLFKEKLRKQDWLGLLLIVLAAVLVVWA